MIGSARASSESALITVHMLSHTDTCGGDPHFPVPYSEQHDRDQRIFNYYEDL